MSFDRALEATLRYEGGYSNHPNDPGGETWQGITRRDHPTWPGWQLVDQARATGTLSRLAADPRMRDLVAALYRSLYWDAIGLDRIASGAVAAKLFDLAVNVGPGKAATLLQRAINYILPVPQEVIEDGSLGRCTVLAANAIRPDLLLMALAGEQYLHYRGLVESEKTTRFEVFAGGWLRRAFGGLMP